MSAFSPIWIRRALLATNLAAPMLVLATGASWGSLVFAAIVHAAFCRALMKPGCSWFGPEVTHFITTQREVWLTIDDGPFGEASLQLSAALRDRRVRATFFCKGVSLLAQPGTAHSLLAAGHTLANHTHTHPSAIFWCLWPWSLRAEIANCSAALQSVGASPQRWFRSPVGLKHAHLAPTLKRLGLRLIAWDVRGRDGITCEPELVLRRVLEAVKPGGIIVLHEGRPRSIESILNVVDTLQARGYTFTIPSDDNLR